QHEGRRVVQGKHPYRLDQLLQASCRAGESVEDDPDVVRVDGAGADVEARRCIPYEGGHGESELGGVQVRDGARDGRTARDPRIPDEGASPVAESTSETLRPGVRSRPWLVVLVQVEVDLRPQRRGRE